MKFKVEFANGRCTTISCDSNEEAKKELLSVQKRFNSKIISVNNQPIEKLSLGGVLLGAILGGILGNELAKSGVSKTAKTIKNTSNKTISKTKKALSDFSKSIINPTKKSIDRKFVNKSEDYEVRYAKKNNPSRVGYKGNKKYKNGGEVDEEVYIKFLNKEKGFKQDIKEFNSYEEAIEWGKKNIGNFNSDMINYKYEEGGVVTSNNKIADKMEKIKTMSIFADKVRSFPTQITRKDLENILPDYVSGKTITEVLSNEEGGVVTSNNKIADKMEKIKTMSIFADKVRSFPTQITRKDLEEMLPDYVSGGDISKVLSKESKFSKGGVGSDALDAESSIDNYRYAMGGMPPQLAIADQISKRLPATTDAIDKKFAERVNPTRPSMWEDRGLQKMAIGGIIGQEIVFDRWGETATGTITEKMANGNLSVVSGMSSYLVEPSQVLSIEPHTEKTKKGWFFADGGSVNTGLSWHQDRARHNKSESYELPLTDRKKYTTGGGVDLFEDEEYKDLKLLKFKESILENKIHNLIDSQVDGWRIDYALLKSELENVRKKINNLESSEL